jgi:hypothetical protein
MIHKYLWTIKKQKKGSYVIVILTKRHSLCALQKIQHQ